MIAYASRRALSSLPVLAIVATLTFAMIRVLPGDLAEVQLGQQGSPEAVRELRVKLGLDRPLIDQYAHWLRSAATGDFGASDSNGRAVTAQFFDAFPATAELAVLSMCIALFVSIPLGIVAALRPNSIIDHAARIVAVAGQAVPSFWIATIALIYLSIYASWSPPIFYRSFWQSPADNFGQMVIPVLILAWSLSSVIVRIVRSEIRDIMGQDFVRTARSKGLAQATVLYRHVMRHALIPTITVAGVKLSAIIGGTVILEQIFALPGVGKLTLQALLDRDYTQLQFNVLMFAVGVVLLNLLVDLCYALVDPRLTSRKARA